jgi:hypothetical protein
MLEVAENQDVDRVTDNFATTAARWSASWTVYPSASSW